MKIFIAEDEPLAAAKLKVFLEKLGEGGDISLFDNGITAMAALTKEIPDLMFLDIQMPGLTGMQILERLSSNNAATTQGGRPYIVITSAYDQYAIDSFAYDVTDYLLKPYSLDRLRVAVDKARNRIRLQQLDSQINATTLSVRCDGRTEILSTNDIISLESLKDYVRITTRNGRHLMVLATMGSLMEQLPADDFARIHRSYIINVNEITAIGAQSVAMSDGSEIAIGKTYKENISQLTK